MGRDLPNVVRTGQACSRVFFLSSGDDVGAASPVILCLEWPAAGWGTS